ncbi:MULTISPECIES: CPBP family intramembrane glutamic endopeptidase [unclassified Nocardioides]|uniref:CPBP family intramembrane glutamic endopeptidase n=1 Tax=Nocardioides sp. URHA0032 TaxID=1380388 RepID=UPI000684E036|nr:CPBP family intramembrane glutamic endopeptidase [Nocardioides sp. URHA0032]
MRDRRLIAAAFVVLGGAVLGVSLRIPPGSAWFYAATLALAGVWVVAAYAVGPPRLGPPRPVLVPVAAGAALVGLFVVGSFVVRQVAFLDGQVRDVADHAARGSWPLLVLVTVVTGIAEELFFRGAAYDLVPRHPVAVTTAVYGLTTLATGNLLLAFAAVVLGVIVALERRRYDALLPPILTHCTWSLTMLFLLPALFQR